MTDTHIIETPGRPSTYVMLRDTGGFIVSQSRNRVWLSADEAEQLITILKDPE